MQNIYLSKLKMFQKTLRLSSSSVQFCGGSIEGNGFNRGSFSRWSDSMLNWRYSTVLVKDPTIDHALDASPFPI